MDCFTCQHFYVTWDKAYPKGCRQYNFKTPMMPSFQIKQAIGHDCPGYSKKHATSDDKAKDEERKRLW